MLSISLGPIALPVAPLVLLLAVWGASWLASRLMARAAGTGAEAAPPDTAGNTVLVAALLGLVAARLVHLALEAPAYAATPWAVFDLRDGGWHAPSGAIAGAAWLAWRGLRCPALRRPLALGGAAGLAFWLVASAALHTTQPRAMPALAFTPLGSTAPQSLAQAARGRPVVVNLWASWCGPCRQEMPLLAAAQQHEAAVGFLFVNQGESESAVRAYLTDQGLPLHEVLLDPRSTLGPAIGSRGLPTTLFYDAQGRQVDAHFGVLSAAALESRLRRLRGNR
ncbi:MAG: TlpA family protein disulfide reductase [Rhizobacter sp.]|nr:TlpA family protein disulfide reductase [Rhizobacter sp.]